MPVRSLGIPAPPSFLRQPYTTQDVVTVDAHVSALISVQFINSSNGIVGWVQSQQYISALQTNVVLSSHRYTLFSSNAFLMTGSNFVGRFPQLYNWNLVAPQIGSGGMTPPTTLPEALWGSYSGTNSWFALTNGFVCWSNISLSIVGTNTAGIGGITIYGLDHPELYGNVISFDGQTLLSNGGQIATLNDLSATVHVLAPPVQMAGAWVLDSQTTNGETVTFYNHNTAIFTLTGFAAGIPMAFGGVGAGTNMLITTPVTNLVTGWLLEAVTNLSPPVIWYNAAGYTMATNSGIVTFTVPMNFSLQCQFFRLRNAATQTAAFSVPVAAPGVSFTLYTITNATDSTLGLPVGTLRADLNYLYMATGSNQWKRAALNSW